MACGCNNTGSGYYGGCNCNNTVQYAPSACNPNFPTTCTALGTGVIQRVVGEDYSSCKYTVPTILSNSILTYNQSTGLVNWGDGSSSNPIFLGGSNGAIYPAQNIIAGNSYTIVFVGTTSWTSIGASSNTVGVTFTATGVGSGTGTASIVSSNQVSSTIVGAIQGTTPTGQLVAFKPSTSSETQFPVISPSGTTTAWGTIENIVPTQGLVYRPSVSGTLGSVAQLTGSSGQVVSFDANGNPYAVAATAITGTSVPSGAVLPFAYNVTSGIVPAGWLLCDGSVYTTAAYPTLGALLGNTYGGSTGTFGVPNLSGLFIRGAGTQTSGGITYSAGTIGTIQADNFQGHEHSYGGTAVSNTFAGGSGSGLTGSAKTTTSEITDGTNGTPRYGTETRPVNLAMVYCIKI